ncbi:hypothetical protein BLOT_003706 [Blomia tropicalis]|nr:hypothetical protein BLOT_003706 [Blomia tropicalis]
MYICLRPDPLTIQQLWPHFPFVTQSAVAVSYPPSLKGNSIVSNVSFILWFVSSYSNQQK